MGKDCFLKKKCILQRLVFKENQHQKAVVKTLMAYLYSFTTTVVFTLS